MLRLEEPTSSARESDAGSVDENGEIMELIVI